LTSDKTSSTVGKKVEAEGGGDDKRPDEPNFWNEKIVGIGTARMGRRDYYEKKKKGPRVTR